MRAAFSRFLDWFSDFFSQRKGLLPLLGIVLVLLNYGLQWAGPSWVVETDLFLHLGVIVAIFGFLVAWAL